MKPAAVLQNMRANPIVVAMLLVAAAIGAYYVFLGTRYWTTASEISSMRQQIQDAASLIQRSSSQSADTPDQSTGVTFEESIKDPFIFETTNDLLAVVSEEAEAHEVTIRSLAVSALKPNEIVGVRYQVLPVRISAEGSAGNIHLFIEGVQGRVPVAGVSKLNLAGLNSTPKGEIEFDFYLSPEPVVTADAANAGAQ